MTEDFDFEPKRILKHKNHVTINEGDRYSATVQHLKKDADEFIEISKNEAAKKYGSKKLVRDLDFNNRDGLQMQKDTGLNKTPDWFSQIIPMIKWDEHESLLYEIDHLWMNMFFVRELYADEQEGREQILELTQAEDGLKLEVLCQLDYVSGSERKHKDVEASEVDGFIEVEIVKEEAENGRDDYDTEIEFKHSLEKDYVASGLREILTGVCLKHDHTEEQLLFQVGKDGDEYTADVLNKDFKIRFNSEQELDEEVSPWVREILHWDGCPLSLEQRKVNA